MAKAGCGNLRKPRKTVRIRFVMTGSQVRILFAAPKGLGKGPGLSKTSNLAADGPRRSPTRVETGRLFILNPLNCALRDSRNLHQCRLSPKNPPMLSAKVRLLQATITKESVAMGAPVVRGCLPSLEGGCVYARLLDEGGQRQLSRSP